MPDPNDQNGGGGASGGGKPPAPPAKSVEEQLKELQEAQSRMASEHQATREELKRVNNLNGVLMQRLNSGGGGNPPNSDGGGMDVRNTVRLKRDFSQMDPTADPKTFAESIVAETAEQVSIAIAREREAQSTSDSLRKSFYENNKDLVGFEIEVGHFSSQVQAQNPGITFDDAAKLIANKTREYLKSRGVQASSADPNAGGGGGNPPHVLPPNSGGGDGKVPLKKPGDDKDKPFNADEEYKKDMEDYGKMRSTERDRDGAKVKA